MSPTSFQAAPEGGKRAGAPGHYAVHHQFTRFRVAKGGHVAGPRRAAGVW
ncbi:MAG: hypothetical protein ACLQED_15815 [Desulfobaccales bacterium]